MGGKTIYTAICKRNMFIGQSKALMHYNNNMILCLWKECPDPHCIHMNSLMNVTCFTNSLLRTVDNSAFCTELLLHQPILFCLDTIFRLN